MAAELAPAAADGAPVTIDVRQLVRVGTLGPRPPPDEILYIISKLCPEGPDDVACEWLVEEAVQQQSLEHLSSFTVAPKATLEWLARCLKRCHITRDLIPAQQLLGLATEYQASLAAAPAPLLWYESDEVNIVASFLPAQSLAAFACSCKTVRDNLKSRDTLRWLADLRGLSAHAHISSLQHLELAEAMAGLSSNIFFGWGSVEVDDAATPSLEKLVRLLHAHRRLHLSVEAHCGLEARYHMPLPGQALEYTKMRALAVVEALHEAAAAIDMPLPDGRVSHVAWGCFMPLKWAFGSDSYSRRQAADPAGAALNRRVELYVRVGDAFEAPRRRPIDEIPLPPGVEVLPLDPRVKLTPELACARQDGALARASNPGGTMEGEFTQMEMRGRPIVFPTALLRQLSVGPAGGEDDDGDDDSDEDEEGEGEWEEWAEDDEEEEEGVPFLDGDSEDDDGDGA